MSIWEYRDIARSTTLEAVYARCCIFCHGTLAVLHAETEFRQGWARHPHPDGTGTYVGKRPHPRAKGIIQAEAPHKRFTHVRRCRSCGWWAAKSVGDRTYTATKGSAGCLKALDLADVSVPVQHIRDYLMGRYDERFCLNPRRLEDTVASVFGDLGYFPVVTNYRGDDGIDVFLRSGTSEIGVQVKRYRNAIEVGQIRELAGSLILRGAERGMFVTTSTFQSGAAPLVSRFAMRGIFIELMDHERFYDALELAQNKHYRDNDKRLIRSAIESMDTLPNEPTRLPDPYRQSEPECDPWDTRFYSNE